MSTDEITIQGTYTGPVSEETLRELAEVPEHWLTKSFAENKWDVQKAGGEVDVMWQAKGVWAPPPVDDDILAKIVANIGKRPDRPVNRTRKRRGQTKTLVEIAMYDSHFGADAAGYDLATATEAYIEAGKDLISRASKSHVVDRWLFPVGNDLLHVDNLQGTTTAGTPMDTNATVLEAVPAALNALVAVIDAAAEIAPVTVLVVPGNHDAFTMHMMGVVLKAWYRSVSDVTILTSSDERHYFCWGEVLLGFTHGQTLKTGKLAGIMAAEVPDLWGKTKFREFHTGHFHTQGTREDFGVRHRQMAAMTPADQWHRLRGYVKNIRAAEAYVWDSTYGLTGTFHFYLGDN